MPIAPEPRGADSAHKREVWRREAYELPARRRLAARCGPRDDYALRATGAITDAMSTRELEGKTALITGASKGLGRAMALALADAGARLALVSRNLELLNETASAVRRLGAEAAVFTADVTDEAQVLRLEKAVAGQFGKVQILILLRGRRLHHRHRHPDRRRLDRAVAFCFKRSKPRRAIACGTRRR
jgi:short chain dehydrogenase